MRLGKTSAPRPRRVGTLMDVSVAVETEINAAVDRVWKELAAFESHVEWMKDAVAIRFETDRTQGIGTVLLIDTRVGPLRTTDRFEITELVPKRIIRGRHTGLFQGVGRFELTPVTSGKSRLVWQERIRFPWRYGGPVGAWVGRILLARIWKSNLERLKNRIEPDTRLGVPEIR